MRFVYISTYSLTHAMNPGQDQTDAPETSGMRRHKKFLPVTSLERKREFCLRPLSPTPAASHHCPNRLCRSPHGPSGPCQMITKRFSLSLPNSWLLWAPGWPGYCFVLPPWHDLGFLSSYLFLFI